MTWIGLATGIYIKPINDTAFYAIMPNDDVSYKLTRHCTTMCDATLIGTYPDPHTAMYAAQKEEKQRVG